MKSHFLLGALAAGLLSSCASSSDTYYPQAKDEQAYRAAHGGARDQLLDNEADISQSRTDAHQGLNLPHDQPGVANDGLGWYGYR